MEPTKSPQGTFITFIAINEDRPIFYAHSKEPFEPFAKLSHTLDDDMVMHILELLEKAYLAGQERGKTEDTHHG